MKFQQKDNKDQPLLKEKITAILTVVFVWALIIFLLLSYLILFVPLMLTYSSKQFYILMPIFFVCLIFGCYSYFMAIFVSPGYPNPQLNQIYEQKLEDFKKQGNLQSQLKRKRKQLPHKLLLQNLTYYSYCFKCDNVKLPRTHHCKICGICITRMDHHCPWIGNCVGKYNHKYFVLFQLYVTICLLIVGLTILADIINNQEMISRLSDLQRYIIIGTAIMSFMLMISIGFLLVTQIIMITQNFTTLQSFYDGINQQNNNPFDTGSIIQNVKQIMGDSCWFLPTQPFPQKKNLIKAFNLKKFNYQSPNNFGKNSTTYHEDRHNNISNNYQKRQFQHRYIPLNQNQDHLHTSQKNDENRVLFYDFDKLQRKNILMTCC